VALAGVAAALAAAHAAAPALAAAAAAILVGVATGLVNGTLIAYCRVPAFVATLAMLTAARGLAFLIAGGRSHGDLPDSFGFLGRAVLAGIPMPVIVMAVVMGAGAFLLSRTVYGPHLYAVGGNSDA